MQAILVDLDETLYEPGGALIRSVDARITAFIAMQTGLPWDRADALRRELWLEFGTTARGLNFRYDINERTLNRFAVDAVDPAAHISPDRGLDEALARITVPCYVFTNATRKYTERVLEALGVRRHFRGIFSIEFSGYHPKPSPHFYREVVAELGLPPSQIALVEDNLGNLDPALEMGMACVYVGSGAAPSGVVRIGSFREVPDALGVVMEQRGGGPSVGPHPRR